MGPRSPEKGPIWVHSGHVATFYAFDRMVRTFLHCVQSTADSKPETKMKVVLLHNIYNFCVSPRVFCPSETSQIKKLRHQKCTQWYA